MIILNGNLMDAREALHDHLKEKLGLPDYYGGNLDALNDCLGERAERTLVVIEEASAFLEGNGPYAAQVLRVFADNGVQVLLA